MSEVKKREGDRQVSFLDKKAARWLREEAPAISDGLCLARFHADMEAEGVSGWKAGDTVMVDGMAYEITITGKRCFPECGLLQRSGAKCPLADGVAFGRMAAVNHEEKCSKIR